jgi:ribosomal protein S18 acetylase RimI-like enzyme
MDNYKIRELPTDEFGELWVQHGKKFFEDESQIFRLRNALSESELKNIDNLKSNLGSPIRVNLGIYYNNEFVGWSWGYQESAFRFYMCNSAIFPEHRRKGLYTMLMNEMIEHVSKLGFQEIYSRHTTTNNAVIIPKLKAGFLITTIEMTDLFGALIHLAYFPNQLRKKMLDYRVGQIKPDEEIKKHLGL